MGSNRMTGGCRSTDSIRRTYGKNQGNARRGRGRGYGDSPAPARQSRQAVTEITLTTGRKVRWTRVPGKDHKLDVWFGQLPDRQVITNDERREAAAKINEVLQPDKETFNAA